MSASNPQPQKISVDFSKSKPRITNPRRSFIRVIDPDTICPITEDLQNEIDKEEKEKKRLEKKKEKAEAEKENTPQIEISLKHLDLKANRKVVKTNPKNSSFLTNLENLSDKPSKPKGSASMKSDKKVVNKFNRKFQSALEKAYDPKALTGQFGYERYNFTDGKKTVEKYFGVSSGSKGSKRKEYNLTDTLALTGSVLKKTKIEIRETMNAGILKTAEIIQDAKVKALKDGKKFKPTKNLGPLTMQDLLELEEKEQKKNDKKSVDPSNDFEQFIQTLLARPYKPPVPGYLPPKRRTKNLGMRGNISNIRRPLHDPFAENALVLYHPPAMTKDEYMRCDKTKMQVHVVVDPLLGNVLRPHQREGVKFMYDCVAEGIKFEPLELNLKPLRNKTKKKQVEDTQEDENIQVQETENQKPQEIIGQGCILADDMGLGKTLQCVALIYTLVKQSKEMCPLVEKCIVISPSSLVKNWANEVTKWLSGRVKTLPIETGSITREVLRKQMQQFMDQVRHTIPVMFISYETLRGHIDIIGELEIGLIICDEGHRLKNRENQTYEALNNINCKRRVLLSGTPIQNDLLEYYSLVNFVNRGCLGDPSDFRRYFETPILRGRDSFATQEEHDLGNSRLKELLARVNKCMLRRTAEILIEYLPIKHELVIAVPMTPLQKALYVTYGNDMANLQNMKSVSERKEYKSKKSSETGGGGTSSALQVITYLRKICAHPTLLFEALTNPEKSGSSIPVNDKNSLLKLFPPGFKGGEIDSSLSGKMILLDSILALTRATTDDRFVLVSNFTETLELCERLCQKRCYKFVRLDGSMSVKKRAKIVADFNKPNPEDGEPAYIFMLSSKAGGCGLNIIGANRLIMFEPDWNPANDGQAMARVWRDGQKKTCYIYRFVNTGTIDEKIFQRQTHKKALSSCVVDGQQDVDRHFSVSELRELFRLNENTICETHDKLKCKRCSKGELSQQIDEPDEKSNTLSDLKDWWHCHNSRQDRAKLPDDILRKTWDKAGLTFTMHNQSHKSVRKTV